MKNQELKIILILLFFFNFNTSKSFGQNFTFKADSLMQIGDTYHAIDEYYLLIEKNMIDSSLFYNLSRAWAHSNNLDSSFHYLTLSIDHNLEKDILINPDFYPLLLDERWYLLEEKILAKQIEEGIIIPEKISLAKRLWRLRIKDQAYSYHYSLSVKNLGRTSPVTEAIIELKRKLNEENLQEVETIVSQYGWPKISEVGLDAAGAALLVIQHQHDVEVQKRYLPLIKEAANQNEAKWNLLALLIDRINLREGLEQVYGTQVYGKPDGSYFVPNLIDPEYVNHRRKAVGLGPIEEYLENWNIEWNIEQKEH